MSILSADAEKEFRIDFKDAWQRYGNVKYLVHNTSSKTDEPTGISLVSPSRRT
jgi:hypothetical protein